MLTKTAVDRYRHGDEYIPTREQRKQLLSSYTHKLWQQFSPKGIIIRPTSWCQVSMHQEICMPLYTCTCTVVGGVNWVQVTQKSICLTGQEYSYYTSLNSVHHILQLWPGLPDGLRAWRNTRMGEQPTQSTRRRWQCWTMGAVNWCLAHPDSLAELFIIWDAWRTENPWLLNHHRDEEKWRSTVDPWFLMACSYHYSSSEYSFKYRLVFVHIFSLDHCVLTHYCNTCLFPFFLFLVYIFSFQLLLHQYFI